MTKVKIVILKRALYWFKTEWEGSLQCQIIMNDNEFSIPVILS